MISLKNYFNRKAASSKVFTTSKCIKIIKNKISIGVKSISRCIKKGNFFLNSMKTGSVSILTNFISGCLLDRFNQLNTVESTTSQKEIIKIIFIAYPNSSRSKAKTTINYCEKGLFDELS